MKDSRHVHSLELFRGQNQIQLRGDITIKVQEVLTHVDWNTRQSKHCEHIVLVLWAVGTMLPSLEQSFEQQLGRGRCYRHLNDLKEM